MLAPICLFTYNRITETQQTIAALQQNFLAKESELFIFSDGAKNEKGIAKVNEVRTFLKSISGFKSVTIYESPANKGLANSIIDGVSQIIAQFGKVIVLEDDLITSPNFLDFMNQALVFYYNNSKIQSISGYSLKIKNRESNFDIHFQKRAHSWGWATWENRWNIEIFNKESLKQKVVSDSKDLLQFRRECGADIDKMLLSSIQGKIDSWYVWWVYNHYLNKRMAVYPMFSKIKNIGYSDESTHCQGINVFKIEFDTLNNRKFEFTQVLENKIINKQFLNYFKMSYKLLFRIKLLGSLTGIRKVIKEVKYRLQ